MFTFNARVMYVHAHADPLAIDAHMIGGSAGRIVKQLS